MSDDSGRIGLGFEIVEDPDGGKPVFKIIRHDYEIDHAGPGVRPCSHPRFILDEKWATVTCEKCRVQVDPFSVLMVHAEYWEHIEHSRRNLEEVTRKLYVAELRRLSRLRAITPDEAAEIKRALDHQWSLPADEAKEISDRIEKAVKVRRHA